MTEFAHLHNHTEYSMLDGLAKTGDYVNKAKSNKQQFLAITDHGNLCGAHEFYRACRENEIEPILGEEFYFSRHERGANSPDRYHVVVLAKGFDGYKALSELSTAAHSNFYYKPLLTRDMIAGQKDVIVLSGCAASIISSLIKNDEIEEAEVELNWWMKNVPHFYLELQQHNNDFDRKINLQLLKFSKKYKIPYVITNDPHYALEEDCNNHDVLLALQTASNIDDPDRFRFSGDGYWLKDFEEMQLTFKDYKKEIFEKGAATSMEVAQACQLRIPAWEERKWFLPKFPDTNDSFDYLKKEVVKSLRAKKLYNNTEYRNRAIYELKVIRKVGIADFLLIARDCIKWADEQGIPVGPGRGSVAGSLVCFLIGIHKIDSIKYDLMFERFLNPARPKMPDIDIDFGPERREELFQYVINKYGEENVMHFAAFQRMKTKATFQALAKAYGIPYVEATKISKTLDATSEEPDLPSVITDNYPEIAAQLKSLAGTKKSISTHPAGVIIANPDIELKKIVPQMWIPSTKKWVAQYDLNAIEKMGLMKQDFLGLRALDTIRECVRLVPGLTKEQVDNWVPNEEPKDDEIYRMLSKGKTAGVFQLEGDACRRGVQQMGCKAFEDIAACISLYRAGPLTAGYPERFIYNRKIGKKNIEFPHEMLREILEPTWGVAIYQEQVMKIVETLGGFSMIQVDDFKEAIRFKSIERMQKLEEMFLAGAKEKGMKENHAISFWAELQDFYTYAFNKNHAFSYALLSYQTARLRYLYPIEYLAALLRTVKEEEKRLSYLVEATDLKIKILPPDINISDQMTLPDAGCLRMGLSDIKGVGPKATEKILKARMGKFNSYEDVVTATKNKGVIEKLTSAGAFKSMGIPGDSKKMEELLGWSFHDKMSKVRQMYANDVTLPGTEEEDIMLIGELVRKENKTTANKKPYQNWHIRWSPSQTYLCKLWSSTKVLWDTPTGSLVQVEGTWQPSYSSLSIGNPKDIKVLKNG